MRTTGSFRSPRDAFPHRPTPQRGHGHSGWGNLGAVPHPSLLPAAPPPASRRQCACYQGMLRHHKHPACAGRASQHSKRFSRTSSGFSQTAQNPASPPSPTRVGFNLTEQTLGEHAHGPRLQCQPTMASLQHLQSHADRRDRGFSLSSRRLARFGRHPQPFRSPYI